MTIKSYLSGEITMSAKSNEKMLLSVFTALFAALIAVSGFISIPLPGSPVPIVLQNMMPVLAAALLGGFQGAGATGLFLLAGVLGLPVFAGGRIINGNKLARAGVEASEIQKQISENNVELTATQYYWQIISLKEKQRTLDAIDRHWCHIQPL